MDTSIGLDLSLMCLIRDANSSSPSSVRKKQVKNDPDSKAQADHPKQEEDIKLEDDSKEVLESIEVTEKLSATPEIIDAPAQEDTALAIKEKSDESYVIVDQGGDKMDTDEGKFVEAEVESTAFI